MSSPRSGKRNDRPKLEKALAACPRHGAKLVIAKLDLSRNLAFIAMLMDRKVDLVCCDNPAATEAALHILAAIAEHERDTISPAPSLRLLQPRPMASGWATIGASPNPSSAPSGFCGVQRLSILLAIIP